MSLLLLAVSLDMLVPLLPLQLLAEIVERLPQTLNVVVSLFLLLVLIVFLMNLEVMDVVVIVQILLIVVAAPKNK